MSLINTLLQDLEQRQAAAGHNEQLATGLRAVPSARRRGSWVVAAVLLLPLAAATVWFLRPATTEAPAAKLALAPAPKPAPVITVAAPAPAATVAAPAPAPAPVTVTVAVAAPVAVAPPVRVATKMEPPPNIPAKPAAAPAAPAAKPAAAEDVKLVAMAPTVLKNAPAATEPAAAQTSEKPAPRVATAPAAPSPKTVSPQQLSDNLYRQAVLMTQQGHGKDARLVLARSLEAAPRNAPARQLLASLLIEGNSLAEAVALLSEGVKISPEQSRLWMSLARLQLENGDASAATATLEQGLPSAADDGPYHAFYAVMLQRSARHDDAVKHYLVSLRSDPSMPNWLVGIGISLQAVGREDDAIEAFQRAKDSGQLPSGLTAFVDQRLTQLRR